MLPVGIVTTEDRNHSLELTLRSLKAGSPEANIQVFSDLQSGLYWNHKAAWSRLFEQGDRALLMQDDVRASKEWLKTVQLFADKFPDADVINFFNPFFSGVDSDSIARGYEKRCTLWEQSLLIKKSFYEKRTQYIEHPERFEKYVIKKRPGDYHHDWTVMDAAKHLKAKCILVTPPFFQHAEEVSTVGNPTKWKGRPRVCKQYIGDDANAYEYFSEKLK